VISKEINFSHTLINDPIHGAIYLSKVERDLISTTTFQRLHNVKQLGLGFMVYPGANYSRFSHSLGACHLAGKMYDAIRHNSNRLCTDKEKQLYRIAALLHDVGHYPFSHTFEHAAKDLNAMNFLASSETTDKAAIISDFQDHEDMGEIIVRHCPHVSNILKNNNINQDDLISVYRAGQPGQLTAILSSDLDCDRMDYMLRTSHHAGLPYGKIDANYLVSTFTVDESGFVCLKRKGMKAADHMLLSRYFDYTQLAFHKTLVTTEHALIYLIQTLIKDQKVKCSKSDMITAVEKGRWSTFDDQYLTSMIRSQYEESDNISITKNVQAFLYRKPAKLVFNKEIVGDTKSVNEIRKNKTYLEGLIPKLAKKFGVEEENWHIRMTNLKFTKSKRSQIENPDDNYSYDESECSELVRILGANRRKPKKSVPLIVCDNSLLYNLSDNEHYHLRIYVDLDKSQLSLRDKITQHLLDLPITQS